MSFANRRFEDKSDHFLKQVIPVPGKFEKPKRLQNADTLVVFRNHFKKTWLFGHKFEPSPTVIPGWSMVWFRLYRCRPTFVRGWTWSYGDEDESSTEENLFGYDIL